MLRKKEEMAVIDRPRMHGGNGTVYITQILKREEMMGNGRLFGKVQIDPGCSCGDHSHSHEAEIFYIISGVLEATEDGGEPMLLCAGDVPFTGHGHSHSIANKSSERAIMIAVILNGDDNFE